MDPIGSNVPHYCLLGGGGGGVCAMAVAWPSGPRRWIKAPVPAGAWVRIPPLPQSTFWGSAPHCPPPPIPPTPLAPILLRPITCGDPYGGKWGSPNGAVGFGGGWLGVPPVGGGWGRLRCPGGGWGAVGVEMTVTSCSASGTCGKWGVGGRGIGGEIGGNWGEIGENWGKWREIQ